MPVAPDGKMPVAPDGKMPVAPDGKMPVAPDGKMPVAPTATPTRNSIAHLESIHRRKTGAMIRVSLRLGGMAVGASPEQLAALDAYGDRVGLAFQVTDDLLDVRSRESDVGKRVGKDAQKGKLTYPSLLGVEPSAAYAAKLISEACDALEPFGPSGMGKNGTGTSQQGVSCSQSQSQPGASPLFPHAARAEGLNLLARYVLERNR
jgi:geranylgeranyl diphosphate synthase type II